jgi:hypothetical protein
MVVASTVTFPLHSPAVAPFAALSRHHPESIFAADPTFRAYCAMPWARLPARPTQTTQCVPPPLINAVSLPPPFTTNGRAGMVPIAQTTGMTGGQHTPET